MSYGHFVEGLGLEDLQSMFVYAYKNVSSEFFLSLLIMRHKIDFTVVFNIFRMLIVTIGRCDVSRSSERGTMYMVFYAS